MKVITTEKKPIKMWLNEIEDGALNQARNIANLPFVFKHVAIMPDSHQGYGMPIGGVMATKGVVVPNAVGVDIGCGMCAIRTTLKHLEKEQLEQIIKLITEKIPVGFNHHKTIQERCVPNMDGYNLNPSSIVFLENESAHYQIGTLGGGNHFIEIQKGSDQYIWIMIHSGSRNLGYKVAKHYNKLAIFHNQRWFSGVNKELELAFLPIETKEANDYMHEMMYCVDFALANRKLMMERVKESFLTALNIDIVFDNFINIAHNYAKWERHFNTNVIVHRKGATSANNGERGIIPGSQGTKSYIVEGLGNTESFKSCSHGAGRTMGRKQAQRELDLETEIAKMTELGVLHNIKDVSDLDEAAGAYKDIDVVMENQKDLVKVLVELKPLAVIKG